MTNVYDLTKANQPFDLLIASRVKELRISRKMTALQLSKILGINERQIYKHESGKFWISSGRLLLIAKALDVPVTYFYQGITNKYVNLMMTESLGAKIKWARLIANFSIKDACKKLNITMQQLHDYENDIEIPALKNAIEMTQLYNIDLNIFSKFYNKSISPDKDSSFFVETKGQEELIEETVNESEDKWSIKSTYNFLKTKLRG